MVAPIVTLLTTYGLAGRTSPDSRVRDLASLYRPLSSELKDVEQLKGLLAIDVAFYMGWLGYYIADAAQLTIRNVNTGSEYLK